MKRITFLVLTFFFGIGNLFSQSDFRSGYIIKNNNDTIYGYVNYKGDLSNTKKCEYKDRIDGAKVEFSPDEIIGYRFIDSKYYVSKSVKTGDGEELVFLEYLIDGIVDIFYNRNEHGDHYYVDQGDGHLVELKHEEKEVYVNNKKYLSESKEYVGVLKYAFKESPTQSKKVDNLRLSHKSLIRIANDYHTEVCTTEECIIYEKEVPKAKFTFGPVIGFHHVSVSVWNEFDTDLYYLNDSNFESDSYPSFGLFLKIGIPRVNERMYAKYEISYSTQNYQSVYLREHPYSHYLYTDRITLKQNVISNVGVIGYEFPDGKLIRPVFQAGGFFSLFTNSEYAFIHEITRPDEEEPYSSTGNDNSPFKSSSYGVDLGVGCIISFEKMWDVNLDFRYQFGTGLRYGVSTHHFFLNLGFQIGK